jgi:hypothetical protein
MEEMEASIVHIFTRQSLHLLRTFMGSGRRVVVDSDLGILFPIPDSMSNTDG